jgi:hypothetical protein
MAAKIRKFSKPERSGTELNAIHKIAIIAGKGASLPEIMHSDKVL